MIRWCYIVIVLFLFVSDSSAQTQATLKAGFENPPAAAKPRTWWHWLDGNITKEGITLDLEAMQRVGIQEAQIFNVGMGYPQGPVTYLSPEWLKLFHFAASEAKRLGMEIALQNSPGWSSSGGPWVTPANSMQTVVYTRTSVEGGRIIKQLLQQPPSKHNYYEDIAVIAFPTPKGDQRIDKLELKSLSGDQFPTQLNPDDKVIESSSIIDKASVTDITSYMKADGTLEWNAPAGKWTIIRFGHTTTGTENHPALAGGKGLEVDKLSRSAMDDYWAAGIQPILNELGDLVGTTLNNCLIDSYEVGCGNWTNGFKDVFNKKCGYDLTSFMPALAGYYVQSGEITERFLWDFRKVIGDMMAENYFGYFGELCHKAGMNFSVEPYGGPFEALKAGATADIIMGEFWMGSTEYAESPKLAASIAHVSGKTFVGAESFTSQVSWLNHPATLKPLGDLMWTNGVNRFIFHTYTHQPFNTAPGFTFRNYGLEVNRMNTWWEQGSAYMNYIARSQYLLQQGKSFADVLVFTGESSPNAAMLRPDIKALGYDYDQIGTDQLYQLTVKDGKLITPYGTSYGLLILPETKYATPALLQKIKELVNAGATIIGSKPTKSPGLTAYPNCDVQTKQLADELWASKISTQTNILDIFKSVQLVPDFKPTQAGADINFIHRVIGDEDVYFIANAKKEQYNSTISFRVSGRQPAIWDPSTGKINEVVVWQKGKNNTTEIPLKIEGNGSMFIVFSKASSSMIDLSSIKNNLQYPKAKPLAELAIIKAEYGTFLPNGMGDVTEAITKAVTKDSVLVAAVNGLLPDDPAPGSVKELRMDYELGGQKQYLSLIENQQTTIHFNNKPFKITRAVYGKFTQEVKGVPFKYPVYDVTEKLNNLINANTLSFPVTDQLFNAAPLNKVDRELRVIYTTEEEKQNSIIPKNSMAHFEQSALQPNIVLENEKPVLITPHNGTIQYRLSNGSVKTTTITGVPKPVELTGNWVINFPLSDNIKIVTYRKLVSWAKSADEDIRYFSGTATYKKRFVLDASMLATNNSLELDLGTVKVIAEVTINGKNLGIIWKAPYRIDITDAVHTGNNNIEIKVTNLWPNRLIGDEQRRDDITWKDGVPAVWPNWLTDTTIKRNSERTTFTTWKHWKSDAALQPTGLIGPVVIRAYMHKRL